MTTVKDVPIYEALLKNKEYKEERKKKILSDKVQVKIEKGKVQSRKKTEKIISANIGTKHRIASYSIGDNKVKRLSQGKIIPKKKLSLRIDAILPRYLAGEKILKKEQDWLQKRLIDEADKYFGRFIRHRDKDKDCITGALETCQHQIMNCCHRISRGYYSHRRDEKNCAGGCVSCNKHHAQDHGAMFENIQIKRYGIERVDKQRFIKNKVKPTIRELVGYIEYYKEKTKNI